jgi:2-dehydropantoate 2-reductase
MNGLSEFPTIKRVCIFGTGGVGGYYGGKIAEAFQLDKSKTREVYFIARGEHLKAIQQNGVQVKTPDRLIRGTPTKVTDDFGKIPPPDLVLLCVKSYDLICAVESIKTNIQDNAVIIPLLNGVDIYQRIRTLMQIAIVLPSCIYLGTHIENPGVISQSGGDGIILSGKDPRFPWYPVEDLRRLFKESGIGFKWSEDPYPDIWEKFIFIASFGLVTAWSGKTLGEVMANERLSDTVRAIIQEIVSIAEKMAVELPEGIAERTMNKANNFPFEARTSYQRDVESWPKPNEGDLYGGAILREGAACGVPTPVTDTVYSQILRK